MPNQAFRRDSQAGRAQVLLLVLGVIIVLAAIAAVGLKFWAASKAEDEVAKVAETMRAQGFMDMAYDDVGFSLMGMNVVIDNVRLNAPTGGTYNVDRIVVRDFDLLNDVPEHMTLEFKDLSVPVDERNFGPEWESFRDMGYETLTGDMVIDYRVDRANNRIQLKEFSFDVADMGRLTLSFTLGQINPDNVLAYMMDPSAITVESVELAYTDASLVQRSLEQAARDQSVSPDELRAQALASMDEVAAEARTVGSARGMAVMQALQEFIKNPQRIRLTARPAQPVSVGSLMAAGNQYAIMDLLNVEARNN